MKFSIRDILWLTLLAALAVGWWLDRRSISLDRQLLRQELFAEQRALARARVAEIDKQVELLAAKVREAQCEAAEHARATIHRPAAPSP
jgi:hypothetical protein